jgi:hypothetical protein
VGGSGGGCANSNSSLRTALGAHQLALAIGLRLGRLCWMGCCNWQAASGCFETQQQRQQTAAVAAAAAGAQRQQWQVRQRFREHQGGLALSPSRCWICLHSPAARGWPSCRI